MTASKKQIEANKRNAKKGGVKTPEGKEVSKYNAQKHGLLTKQVIVKKSEKKRYASFCSELYDQYRPATGLEEFFVERIITLSWRLRKCMYIESCFMESHINETDMVGIAKITHGDAEFQGQRDTASLMTDPIIDRILRYETAIDKNLHKALSELEKLQGVRKRNQNGFVSQKN